MNPTHTAVRLTIKAASLMRSRTVDNAADHQPPEVSPDPSGVHGPETLAQSSLWSQLGHQAAHHITARVVERLSDHAVLAIDRALLPRPSAAAQARALWRTSSQARTLLGAVLDASGIPAAKGAALVLRTVTPLIDEMSGS